MPPKIAPKAIPLVTVYRRGRRPNPGTIMAAPNGTAVAKKILRREGAVMGSWRHLTVKLRGRTEAPQVAEGAQFRSPRGAKPQAHHGPLERLSGRTSEP